MEATNEMRAEWAQKAVDAFAIATGIQNEDPETQISDLLADLMHLATSEGLDFRGLLDRARGHFEEEEAEEQFENLDPPTIEE